jgi:hypothetical protein
MELWQDFEVIEGGVGRTEAGHIEGHLVLRPSNYVDFPDSLYSPFIKSDGTGVELHWEPDEPPFYADREGSIVIVQPSTPK